jgi:hypothetical protein
MASKNDAPASRVRVIESSPTSIQKQTSKRNEIDKCQSLKRKRSTAQAVVLVSDKEQPQSPTDDDDAASASVGGASDLMTIHRRALQSLFASSSRSSSRKNPKASSATIATQQQESRLLELQRQRIAAKVELDAYRHSAGIGSYSSSTAALMTTTTTVGDELRRRYRNSHSKRASAEDRPYLHSLDQHAEEDGCLQQALEEHDLADRMQIIRQRRKIAAAYRMAGISMTPCADENVLALRFDILSPAEGNYTACYHAFFDLVVATTTTTTTTVPTIATSLGKNKYDKTKNNQKKTDNNDGTDDDCGDGSQDLYLRLVQHTLPPSIPLKTIVQESLGGGIAMVGPLETEEQWKTGEILTKLRKCSNQLHQACYCYTARKESYAFLQTFTATTAPEQRRNLSDERQLHRSHDATVVVVEDLEPTDTYSKITFRLQLLSGMPSLRVELTYKDAMRSQPTGVTVRNSKASGSGSSGFTDVSRNQVVSIDVISDEEEEAEGTEDLIDTATMAFRRLPMRQAVKEVTTAMLEW